MILFERKNLKALFQTFSADDMMKLRPFINCTLLSEKLYILLDITFFNRYLTWCALNRNKIEPFNSKIIKDSKFEWIKS